MVAFNDLKDVFQPKLFSYIKPGAALWSHTWFWAPQVPLSVVWAQLKGAGARQGKLCGVINLQHKQLDFGSVPHRRHLVLSKMIWAALPGQQLVQKDPKSPDQCPLHQFPAGRWQWWFALGYPWVSQGANFRRCEGNSAWVNHAPSHPDCSNPCFPLLQLSWEKKEQGRQFFKGLFWCFKHRWAVGHSWKPLNSSVFITTTVKALPVTF